MRDNSGSGNGDQVGIAPAGFRLPAASHPGPVTLQVADLARSLEYYQKVLGFSVIEQTENAAALAGAGDAEPVVELRERKGAAPVPRTGRLGLYHYAILLPDRAALGRFITHLASIGARAGASDHFVSEALYLNDPDGLGIEVYSDRPRDAWQYRGREMLMTTEPLDQADLVTAAEGQQWDGMPSGTRIGHVHLHVGDLQDAETFYHHGLGMDKVVWSYPGALFLSVGGYHHHLGLNTWAAGAPSASEDEAHLIEWVMRVPTDADADAALSHLEQNGYAVQRSGAGGTVRDPWGTQLRISAG